MTKITAWMTSCHAFISQLLRKKRPDDQDEVDDDLEADEADGEADCFDQEERRDPDHSADQKTTGAEETIKETDELDDDFIPLKTPRDKSRITSLSSPSRSSQSSASKQGASLRPHPSLSKPPLAKGMMSLSYDTGQSYRMMAWIARLLGIGFFIAMMGVVGLTCLCFSLFPLKEVQPFLIGLKDKGDQVVQIEPIKKNTRGLNRLIEGLCRHYVSLRETIDGVSEQQRWNGELYYLSSPELWAEFYYQIDPEQSHSPLRHYMEKKETRSVIILVSSHVMENVYRVEWESVNRGFGKKEERKRWVSTIAVDLRPNTVKKEAEFINPIGFTVVKYSIAKREG